MEDLVYGRNSVIELLESERTVNKVFILKGEKHGSIRKIIDMAKRKGLVVSEVNKAKLDELTDNKNHQGVAAFTTPYNYVDVDDILARAKERNEKPLIVIAERIEDPHNLGAMIRSAECMGVHGIIIPKRRAVGITETVAKVSAGAIEHMLVSRVNNINDTIEYLKEKGVWIIGTDASGRDNIDKVDLKDSVAIVIGSEGEGMSRLTRERCDILARIPMKGKVTSLNASVSCGMILYEALRQRMI